MPDAILVENLGKRFNRYHAQKPATFMEAALSGLRRVKAMDHFWALRGVSFTVAAGEMLGVIGHNGAGKSTLLQLLGKVAYPTEGRIKMRGRIGALLDLGAGFHSDLTGRENVFVTAIVAGLRHREVERRFDRIVEFAELEAFIDNPVRTYSSGMMMRLAFSVAVHTDPSIMLVDEFLSVGDLSFQTKCLNRINDLKSDGCAIVLVTHDVGQAERLCDRALWLKRGRVMAYGEPTVVAGQYTTEMRSQTQQRTPNRPPQLTQSGAELRVNENRFGSLEAEVTDVRLLPSSELQSGQPLCIEIDYRTKGPGSAIFVASITTEGGDACLDTNTLEAGIHHVRLKSQGT
ncbi:MAG: ABC transporter ATP-binding protein, partial [Elainellaceae cyanobacterium]